MLVVDALHDRVEGRTDRLIAAPTRKEDICMCLLF